MVAERVENPAGVFGTGDPRSPVIAYGLRRPSYGVAQKRSQFVACPCRGAHTPLQTSVAAVCPSKRARDLLPRTVEMKIAVIRFYLATHRRVTNSRRHLSLGESVHRDDKKKNTKNNIYTSEQTRDSFARRRAMKILFDTYTIYDEIACDVVSGKRT